MRCAFVYVTDEQGFELALHSALSLAISQPDPPTVHMFCYRFIPDLGRLLPRGAGSLNLIIDGIGDERLEQHQTSGHVTTPSLLKLLAIDKLSGAYDRIMFLDNDVLVFQDLRIASLEFGTAPIAAVLDVDLSDTGWLRMSQPAALAEAIAGEAGYFNSGVMVFESRNWQGREFYDRYAHALDAHDAGCSYKIDCTSIDQCALNSTFRGNWLALPMSYNMQAGAKFAAPWRCSMVRHYCGRRKFIPLSLFRNDSRDVRHLNRIRRRLGHERASLPLLYEAMFRVNALRNYRANAGVRRFLHAARQRGL